MVDKAVGYGYMNIGFIIDRGYFCKANIRYMDEQNYGFVMMVKGIRCHTNFRHPFNLSWSGKTCDIRRSSKTTS